MPALLVTHRWGRGAVHYTAALEDSRKNPAGLTPSLAKADRQTLALATLPYAAIPYSARCDGPTTPIASAQTARPCWMQGPVDATSLAYTRKVPPQEASTIVSMHTRPVRRPHPQVVGVSSAFGGGVGVLDLPQGSFQARHLRLHPGQLPGRPLGLVVLILVQPLHSGYPGQMFR